MRCGWTARNLLVACLLAGAAGLAVAAPPQGDVDQDGDIDRSDLALLVDAMLGPGSATPQPLADLDSDGDCDLADVDVFVGNFPFAPPHLETTTETLDFGAARVDTDVLMRQVTLANPGDGDLTVDDATIAGPHSGDFGVDGPAMPLIIPSLGSTDLNVTFAPSGVGERTATLTIVSDDPAGPFDIPLSGTGRPPPVVFRLNAGGPDYTDHDGNVWVADTGFFVGGDQTFAMDPSQPIGGTSLDTLYQTERWDLPDAQEMTYSFAIEPGLYRVGLHFAEIYDAVAFPGGRVFDVAIEDQAVLTGLDVFSRVGLYQALVENLEVQIDDGSLDIEFLHQTEDPKISAIEVERLSDLLADAALLEWGHILVGEVGEPKNVTLTNPSPLPLTIRQLSFLVTAGVGHDFIATLGGVNYAGGHSDAAFPVDVTIGSGESLVVPVVFAPTEVSDNDVDLEFAGDFQAMRVRLTGVGSDDVGHPFLHVTIKTDPYAVDYGEDSYEDISLVGSSSHTHEFGHVLTAFEWSEGGVPFAMTADVIRSFPLGEHTVTLTIWDDNTPPETLSGSATFKVVSANDVPGALLLYYHVAGGNPATLLDAVPPQADYGELPASLQIVGTSGTIGSSPYSSSVMARLLAQVDLAEADDYEFQASGGSDRRLFVDGLPAAGLVPLSAGRHSVEARFAVNTIGELPAEVTYVRAGGPQGAVPPELITHDETNLIPVINSSPSGGPVAGANQVTLTGLGFFNNVVVHWGGVNMAGVDLNVTPTSIGLTAPPGSGLIAVTVETANGISNSVQYNYSGSAPPPVDFDLSDLVTSADPVSVFAPTQAAWGQDGRLYVGSLVGTITALAFGDDYQLDPNQSQVITTLEGFSNNQILGITTNPFDPPGVVRLYVAHGEIYANGGDCFAGSSAYSGQVSVLTGPDFNVVEPLITDLPVSNHDHAINGLEFDNNGDLLITVGGNTNAGVPSCPMGGLPESPLSATILKAKVSDPNFNGQVVYLESATGLPNDDQVFGDVVDVAPDVDVAVFASGFRNPFDLVLATWNKIYATDNGPNAGYGAASTSATTQGPSPEDIDELNLIEEGHYYGHPNRNLGRYDDRLNVYNGTAELSIPGVFTQAITTFPPSTNGIAEYRAQTFQGAMRGELLTQMWDGQTFRIELSADGRTVASNTTLPVSLDALDVVTGPGGVVIGVDYTDNKLVIARPVDAAAVGLTVYDVFPWRAPAAGGNSFVIGGSGFGDPGNTSVTIGGVPAVLTTVSGTRIRGTIPGTLSPTPELLDVVVTVGAESRLLPAAFRYLFEPGNEPQHDFWQPATPLPAPMTEVAGGFIDGKMYLVGGETPATLAYDVVTGTWTDPSELAPRAWQGDHHAAEVYDGKLYILGAFGSGAGTVQIYDPQTDTWGFGMDPPFWAGSSASAVINGEIYLCGGVATNEHTIPDLAKYDPVADTWTTLTPMLQPRNHAASATDGQKLYIFGGRGPGSGDSNTLANGFDTVQIYDPATDTWVSSEDPGSTLAPLPQARGGMGKAVYFGGEFYVMGGETEDGEGATPDRVYSRVDIYDPVADTWRQGAPMPTPRHGIFPLLHEGRIYVAGGGVTAGVSSSTASV